MGNASSDAASSASDSGARTSAPESGTSASDSGTASSAMKEKSVSTVRRVLVTGANKGIGRELCRRMLSDVPD